MNVEGYKHEINKNIDKLVAQRVIGELEYWTSIIEEKHTNRELVLDMNKRKSALRKEYLLK